MEKTSDISLKLVMIGKSSVGKSSIISRFLEDSFDSQMMPTPGAKFLSKQIYLEKHNKYIWDTAGQERFKALTKIYYQDADIAILVYDITNKESFDDIKNYWIEQLKLYAPKNIIIAIAGNKFDLYENEQVNEELGRGLAKEIKAIFKYTSAKTSLGINELFHTAASKYIDPYDEIQNNDNVISKENIFEKRRDTISIKSKKLEEKQDKKCC